MPVLQLGTRRLRQLPVRTRSSGSSMPSRSGCSGASANRSRSGVVRIDDTVGVSSACWILRRVKKYTPGNPRFRWKTGNARRKRDLEEEYADSGFPFGHALFSFVFPLFTMSPIFWRAGGFNLTALGQPILKMLTYIYSCHDQESMMKQKKTSISPRCIVSRTNLPSRRHDKYISSSDARSASTWKNSP